MVSLGLLNIDYLNDSVFPQVRSPYFPTRKERKRGREGGRKPGIVRFPRAFYISQRTPGINICGWKRIGSGPGQGAEREVIQQCSPIRAWANRVGRSGTYMVNQSCPTGAEMLYTPAMTCHWVWAFLKKARRFSAAEGAESQRVPPKSPPSCWGNTSFSERRV